MYMVSKRPGLTHSLVVFGGYSKVPGVMTSIYTSGGRKGTLTLKLCSRAAVWRAGLSVKFVTVEGFRFAYAERGRPSETQPSILFLHGFSSSKSAWANFINALPRNLHIIALDLPAHGESDRNPDEDVSMEGQANNIHRVGGASCTPHLSRSYQFGCSCKHVQFVCAVGLDRKPLHLVGISMGGGIAGLYAATYRKNIALLTLFCPLGTWYLSCTVSDELGRKEKWDVLQRSMGNISAPTHVIWGREDEVLDVSGADIVREGVPNCRLDILDDCGHVLVNERTRQAVKVFIDFRDEVLNGHKK
ncbi:monoacylglycerol lipase ABHD6-like [Branchiostoma floridae x Branchiostoma japonicum]